MEIHLVCLLHYLKIETHHPKDCIQGEGDVGDGGVTEVYGWPEGLEVKHSLHGLVGWTTVAIVTGQFTVT